MSLPLPEALKDLDYMQLTLHGGRGCFHIAKDRICGRADFWAGHPVFHSFVSLQEAVTKYGQACRKAALEEAALACESAIASIWDYHDDGRKQIGATVCNNLAAAIRALREST